MWFNCIPIPMTKPSFHIVGSSQAFHVSHMLQSTEPSVREDGDGDGDGGKSVDGVAPKEEADSTLNANCTSPSDESGDE